MKKKSNINAISSEEQYMKAVFCILDGCSTEGFEWALRNEIEKQLIKADWFYRQLNYAFYSHSITSFPTITPTEHASLLTGTYPDNHGIPGMKWYDRKKQDMENYFFIGELEGKPGLIPALKRFLRWMPRIGDGIDDLVDIISNTHLSQNVLTIFEAIDPDNTFCFKEFIRRGANNYDVDLIAHLLDKVNLQTLKQFLNHKYQDKSSPDLIVYWKIYTDQKAHRSGPQSRQLRKEVINGLKRAKDIISFYLDRKEPVLLVVTADHGQSKITEKDPVGFENSVKRFKKTQTQNIKVQIADNGRFVYFYLDPDSPAIRHALVSELANERPIDLIFYKDTNNQIQVIHCLQTEIIRQPLASISLSNDMYPNAVERITRIMDSKRAGDILISLKEGYSTHEKKKGDHGSLISGDSLVPLLIHPFKGKDERLPLVSNRFRRGFQIYQTAIQQSRIIRRRPIERFELDPEEFQSYIDIVPTILSYLNPACYSAKYQENPRIFPGDSIRERIEDYYQSPRYKVLPPSLHLGI
ncbi:MAG: alkaline phosphatase family protein [Candidatus Thorarchaeota archaeon]